MTQKNKLVTAIRFTILMAALFMLCYCAHSDKNTDQTQTSTNFPPSAINGESLPVLTSEQQSALAALNTLQVNTDKQNRLYSTFANIVQSCYPPDTSIAISHAQMLNAMTMFVTKHCTNLPVEQRKELVLAAVLAQEEYTVLYCPANAAEANYENGLPHTGTWVLPGVLGRRDVVMVW